MFRITDKFGGTVGFIKEVDTSLLAFLLFPFAPFIILGVIGGIFFLSFQLVSFLLPTLQGFGEGDTLSYEVAGLCIATLISWFLAFLAIVFCKKDDVDRIIPMALTSIPITTYFFTIISLMIVDIIYNDAFGSIFRIVWFILAIILHVFIMLFWTLATSIVGIVFVLVVGLLIRCFIKSISYQIHLRSKIGRIKKSEYLQKIWSELSGEKVRSINITSNDLVIERLDYQKKRLSFMDDGYSELDCYGRLGLASLIHNKYRYLSIKEYDDAVELSYKELLKKESVEQKKESKKIVKSAKKEKKEKLKSGKDW